MEDLMASRFSKVSALAALALGVIAMLLAVAGPASADVVGFPFPVSTTGNAAQDQLPANNPSAAFNPVTHQYLVVWQVDSTIFSAPKLDGLANDVTVYGRFVDAAGNTQGDRFVISSSPACVIVQQNLPSVCSNPDSRVVYNSQANEFFVVFARNNPSVGLAQRQAAASKTTPHQPVDVCPSGGFSQIVGRRVSAAGTPDAGGDQVLSTTSCNPIDPTVAYSSRTNRYLVDWGDEPCFVTDPCMGSHVGGQVVGADGKRVSDTEIPISCTDAASCGTDLQADDADPGRLAYDSRSDHFLAVWVYDTNKSGEENQIRGQLLDSGGGKLASALGTTPATRNPINVPDGGDPGASGAANNPAAEFNAIDGQFLVVYDQHDGQNVDAAVRGQLLGLDGAKTGATGFRISNASITNAAAPEVGWDSNADQYAVVWQSEPFDPTDGSGDASTSTSIFGQMIAADGSAIGQTFEPSKNPDDEEARTVVYDPQTCQFLTAWEGNRILDASIDGTTTTEIDASRLAGAPCADLAVTKVESPSPATVGGTLTYTITVTNNGPSKATGVTLTDNLPLNAGFLSATPSQGSCAGQAAINCSLGSLAVGASAKVTVLATARAPGNVINTAAVSGDQVDPNLANNQATVTSAVVAPAAKRGIRISGIPGGCVRRPFRFSINATSAGPKPTITVFVDGHRISKKRVATLKLLVRLNSLHKGRHHIKVVIKAHNGKVTTRRLTFTKCGSGRKPSFTG